MKKRYLEKKKAAEKEETEEKNKAAEAEGKKKPVKRVAIEKLAVDDMKKKTVLPHRHRGKCEVEGKGGEEDQVKVVNFGR